MDILSHNSQKTEQQYFTEGQTTNYRRIKHAFLRFVVVFGDGTWAQDLVYINPMLYH